MTFKCEAGHTTQPRERMVRTVIETRARVYEPRIDVYGHQDPGGVGWEIVREAPLCAEHAKQLHAAEDEEAELGLTS